MFDIAEYLLEQGSQLEMATVNGATPLIRAIESSKPDLVQFLIDKGAKVQIENKKGEFFWAARCYSFCYNLASVPKQFQFNSM